MNATEHRPDLAELAARCEADRQHVRAVAFRLLGTLADADDAVPSAWLKASSADGVGDVVNLTAWFTTITAHEALLDLLAPGVVRRVDPVLGLADVPTELDGARAVAEETRRFARRARTGAVVLIDGAPGIAIAPRGRAQILLQIEIGADDRIRAIDITADPDRLRRAVLTLPCPARAGLIRYQGHGTRPAGVPATG
ncbi:sigma factor [Mycobacterium simiae]|uniref:sigma factor n=1 Tax=Mycobacterium simiae TaxID=1784 RepID=UPI00041B2380|nr:sigma factor [Mycobacterium simiae]PLV50406.1 hypothetical protein X011_13110 [Mycobacterium tuberculosis variant microti OV254]BBX43343.1 hypothetical protein MSIM_47940 [Mycobacterium simiae]